MEKIVVLMKTHIWSIDIEKFATKILEETIPHGIDFYILMHAENDNILNMVKNDKIKNIILRFTELEIKKIYKVGFFSMWMSNHWTTMWFFKQFKDKYKYFWTFEYDVRICGNSCLLWKHNSECDLLFTLGNYKNASHKYRFCYIGNKLSESQKYYGFLQIARYSNAALQYLDKCFAEGENGQDELIIFSLLNRGGFSSSKKFLRSILKGIWTWQDTYSEYNRILYENTEKKLKQISSSTDPSKYLCIFHPIK
ncbi:MAG: hypothetical protein Satyrvirus30_3 [Satyrvirus sp.]|uniref:Uncharacterized protein n=1 Tax=Satyrvirus sp. TaxID=2487771 RepID=A0A3G5AEW8_9VIRU|nr:MAG: hypothetical protein Satyrvirus30_3 [Satyrvirus sp.]